jgi:hypothetical protein
MEIDYSLNKENIKEFIKKSDKKIRHIVKKIIDNTTYISFKEFKKQLVKSFKKFIKYIKKLKINIVYVYKTKNFENKSNGWIYYLFTSYLKTIKNNIKFILISDEKLNLLNNNDLLLITDDCIYSGHQMKSNLINNIGKNKKINVSLLIYILCPYISSYGINAITYKEHLIEFNYKIIIGYHKKLDKYLCRNFLSQEEIKLMKSYYSNLNLKDVVNDDDDLYYIEFDGFLVYFNHKLADYASTITLFYMGVVPNNYNKKILKERTKNGNKNGNLPLQIIPLINNCNYNIININVNYPICPYPPYKKNDL